MEGTTHFFYGADVAPCGFGWIFPKKGGYTVGVGSVMSRLKRQPLLRNLEYLINEHPIASEILSELTGMSKVEAACVPLKPSSRLCGKGILVVGDAAGQVSPLGGDGIYYAMSAGTLAGKVATEASVEGDVSVDKLREYERLCFLKFGRELRVQRIILEMIEANYHAYMEAWILLNSHRLTRRICEAGSFIGKRVLARTLL
jgi:digeranylgeranylglycerophospholipid reductase